MENNEICVEIVTDKIYFIEDAVNIFFKFNKKVSCLIVIQVHTRDKYMYKSLIKIILFLLNYSL